MHRILLAAGAALVLGWAGQATAAPVGHVGLDYGQSNLDTPLGNGDVNSWRLDGSAAFPSSGALNFAVDGAVQNYDSDAAGSATNVSGTGHLDYRMGDSNLLGGFVGVEHSDDLTLWGLGVEGQANAGMGGVAVQIGYGKSDDLDGVDFWAERIEGRLYPTDNVRLAVNLGGTQLKADDDTSLWNLGATAEYQFDAAPVSVWAGYERGEWDDLDITSDTWRIGVRYNFGGSLRDRDTAGSSLGGVNQLFGGAMGATVITAVGQVLNEVQ